MKVPALALVAACLWNSACQGSSIAPTIEATPAGQRAGSQDSSRGEDISTSLAKLLEASSLPSLSVAIIEDGHLVASGAAGIRKVGSPDLVTRADKYHIGSCTKSMTASLAAMLVESGQITWETTIGDVFEDLSMSAGFRGVRLDELLTNRGGVSGDVDPLLWASLWASTGTPSEARLQLVEATITSEPVHQPGAEFEYSNAGFAIAGAMLERAAGIPYEQLLTQRLFEPLGMTSAGFRAPATTGLVDQPYGHSGPESELSPVQPEPGGDNPTAIAPAGAVHCSAIDLAKYTRFHLGLGPKLLTDESLARLHKPETDANYAMGWGVLARSWGDGAVLQHSGSNTMFYTVIWIAPERDFAAVAMTNAAGAQAQILCDQAIAEAVQAYLD
jgi:CubicO group peptidase (beta-lactamase class C family)